MSAEKVDDIQFANPFADNTFESDFTTTETPAKAALARPNGSALTSESSVEDGMNAMETDEDAQKKKKKLQMLNGSAFNTTAGVQRWWLSPVTYPHFDKDHKKDRSVLEFSPTHFRFWGYTLFFLSLAIAMVLTSFFAHAPNAPYDCTWDGEVGDPDYCGINLDNPWNDTFDAWEAATGKTVTTHLGPLHAAYGYPNLCIYLDFPPANQILPFLWVFAMASFIAAFFFGTIRHRNAMDKGDISEAAFFWLNLASVHQMVCVASFSICFAVSPIKVSDDTSDGYERSRSVMAIHTIPFIMVETALWSFAVSELWFETKARYFEKLELPVWLGTPQGATAYIICLTLCVVAKISLQIAGIVVRQFAFNPEPFVSDPLLSTQHAVDPVRPKARSFLLIDLPLQASLLVVLTTSFCDWSSPPWMIIFAEVVDKVFMLLVLVIPWIRCIYIVVHRPHTLLLVRADIVVATHEKSKEELNEDLRLDFNSTRNPLVNQNGAYKESYDPDNDDVDGSRGVASGDRSPLSSLLACPIIAAMYNSGKFTSLEGLRQAAMAEKFTGWESSPKTLELYESSMTKEELISAFQSVNCSKSVASRITGLTVDAHGNIKLFQLHNARHKHGDATRIRYDHEQKVGGFCQERFDAWWSQSDHDQNDRMSQSEMTNMMSELQNVDNKSMQKPEWLKKFAVFAIVFDAWGGDDHDDGLPRSVFETLYKGQWPGGVDRIPERISLHSVYFDALCYFAQGAA